MFFDVGRLCVKMPFDIVVALQLRLSEKSSKITAFSLCQCSNILSACTFQTEKLKSAEMRPSFVQDFCLFGACYELTTLTTRENSSLIEAQAKWKTQDNMNKMMCQNFQTMLEHVSWMQERNVLYQKSCFTASLICYIYFLFSFFFKRVLQKNENTVLIYTPSCQRESQLWISSLSFWNLGCPKSLFFRK